MAPLQEGVKGHTDLRDSWKPGICKPKVQSLLGGFMKLGDYCAIFIHLHKHAPSSLGLVKRN